MEVSLVEFVRIARNCWTLITIVAGNTKKLETIIGLGIHRIFGENLKQGRRKMNIAEMINKAFIVGVDIDGTLCKGDAYTPKEVLLAEPRWDVIDRIVDLSRSKYIILSTARSIELSETTLMWLNKYNIPYHAIDFRKTPVDVLIDDRAINVSQFLEGG